MSDAADLQRDAQWAGEIEDAVRAAVEERLKRVNTSCPGIVQSFDGQKLTATVKPVHDMLWIEDDGTLTAVPYPLCMDVPVQVAGGAGGALTIDLAEGDECILVFSQRCIDEWHQLGGSRVPGEHRFHDASDAMAIVGLWSQPRAAQIVGGVASGGVELRTLDGSVRLRVDASGVTAGAVSGAVPVMLLTPAVVTWLAAVGTGSSAGPPPASIGATLLKGK